MNIELSKTLHSALVKEATAKNCSVATLVRQIIKGHVARLDSSEESNNGTIHTNAPRISED